MRSVLFVLNYFNDVDHTASLMEKLALNDTRVILLCLTGYRLEDDRRVQHLLRQPMFQVLPLRLLPRTSGTSNQQTGSLSFAQKLFRELVFNRLFAALILFRFSITHCVFTWGRPRAKGFQRHLFAAAKASGKPTYCLPHGQNIYTNYDVNTFLRKRVETGEGWPDFAPRDEFDRYIVQTPRHRRMLIDWGMSETKVHALGSLRFDEKWIRTNASLYAPISIHEEEGRRFKVVFFLPHWRYNVDKRATVDLIEAMAMIPDAILVIKGHTRGDSIDNEHRDRLACVPNLILESPHDSTPLIGWADLIVNFGSSIAIEAIVRGKLVMNPSYLHDNQTVFDNTTPVITTGSIGETIATTQTLTGQDVYSRSTILAQEFLQEEVYAGHSSLDVAQHYVGELFCSLNPKPN